MKGGVLEYICGGEDTHHKKRNRATGKTPITKNDLQEGGIFIQKEITVIDECGNTLAPTYTKRARQLIKQQRAVQLDDNVIQMQVQSGKDSTMDTTVTAMDNTIAVNTTQHEAEATQAQAIQIETPQTMNTEEATDNTAEDEAIMELAKERINAKNKLFRQGLDLLLLAFVLILCAGIYDSGSRACITFLYGLFWFIRYMIRVVKFAKPSFKGGISEYMKKRKERKLNLEYWRIKETLMTK